MKLNKNYHVCLPGKLSPYGDGKTHCVNCQKELPKEKRTRHVFRSYDECAHVWAQQNLGYGSCYRMYFEGRSIYSYGSHFEIARFISPDVVLFTERGYSNTTSTHKWAVHGALSHKTIFEVPNFDDHDKNAEYFIGLIETQVSEIRRGRAALIARVGTLGEYQNTAKRYLDAFKDAVSPALRKKLYTLIKKEFFSQADLKVFAEKSARHEASAERARITREKNEAIRWAKRRAEHYEQTRIKDEVEAFGLALKQERELELYQEMVVADEKWRDEINELNRRAWREGLDKAWGLHLDLYDSLPVMLRIHEDEIQTSRGAYVPVDRAKELWSLVKESKPVHGFKIGHYTVNGLIDGNLVIGCHDIPLREVGRMAVKLGLAQAA